jgi:hypothetical protein
MPFERALRAFRLVGRYPRVPHNPEVAGSNPAPLRTKAPVSELLTGASTVSCHRSTSLPPDLLPAVGNQLPDDAGSFGLHSGEHVLVGVDRVRRIAVSAPLLVVVATSVLITRIATSALVMTGVSRELANFQARSAYTGVGFTTNEAETVVAHGVRRKIILTLMLLGSAGVAGAIASLVAGFAQAGSLRTAAIRLAVLMVGLGLLWWLTTLGSVERLLRRVIERGLERWTDLHMLDYVQLLGMERGYEVREMKVMEGGHMSPPGAMFVPGP